MIVRELSRHMEFAAVVEVKGLFFKLYISPQFEQQQILYSVIQSV